MTATALSGAVHFVRINLSNDPVADTPARPAHMLAHLTMFDHLAGRGPKLLFPERAMLMGRHFSRRGAKCLCYAYATAFIIWAAGWGAGLVPMRHKSGLCAVLRTVGNVAGPALCLFADDLLDHTVAKMPPP